MKRPVLLFSILIHLGFSSCSSIEESGVQLLAETLRSRLISRQFEKIYEEAADHVHINASKEVFVTRAARIVDTLLKVDGELKWYDDDSIGKAVEVRTYSKNTYVSAMKRIGEGNKKITIFISWEKEPGQPPKLFDLSAVSHPNAEVPFHLITIGKINH